MMNFSTISDQLCTLVMICVLALTAFFFYTRREEEAVGVVKLTLATAIRSRKAPSAQWAWLIVCAVDESRSNTKI